MNPIKIGYSTKKNPNDRLINFQMASPYGIEVVGIIPTKYPKELETSLHLKFDPKHIRGEWFDISVDEAKAEIEILTNPDKTIDEVLLRYKNECSIRNIAIDLNVTTEFVSQIIKKYTFRYRGEVEIQHL